jgi:hypothetical protein
VFGKSRISEKSRGSFGEIIQKAPKIKNQCEKKFKFNPIPVNISSKPATLLK